MILLYITILFIPRTLAGEMFSLLWPPSLINVLSIKKKGHQDEVRIVDATINYSPFLFKINFLGIQPYLIDLQLVMILICDRLKLPPTSSGQKVVDL